MSYALVIDDNKQTTDALSQMLKIWNITARSALNPSSAMAILSGDTPSIVFLDINMPGVDGFEVLGYMKREPRLSKIPVIIITSDDQQQTYNRAMDGGAVAVIIKPAMMDILEETLKKIGVIETI